MTDHARQLAKEAEAARILREQLIALHGVDEDDTETIRDTIEGATDLRELIAIVVEDIAKDMADIAGIDAHIKRMKARSERLEKRVEYHRGFIQAAMEQGAIRKLPLPIATLSRRPTQPKVIVTSEAEIPAAYWRRGEPTLDKKLLLSHLKHREETLEQIAKLKKAGGNEEELAALEARLEAAIPGATLSNGGETISFTWK